METPYFPMFINLCGKKVFVAGAGNIALRRIRTLLRFGAAVCVAAPSVSGEVQQLEQEGKIRISRREFQPEDLEGAEMVIAATDNGEVNTQIWTMCRERGILVNVADDHIKCDFYFPSVVMNDEIVVGISSGGKDPAKTKAVRQRLEQILAGDGQEL